MSPETTTVPGPFTAPMPRRPAHRPISSRASSSGSVTEAMPPRPWSSRTARLRRTTMRAPSSRPTAPAITAAETSPWECPTTAWGVTPKERHTSARAIVIAHSTGCRTSTRSCSTSDVPRSTAVSDQSTCGARARSQASIRSRKTGEVSSSSAAMPTHCAPCPGKTKTVLPAVRAVPLTTPRGVAPPAKPASACRSSSGVCATATARCSKAALVVASE